MDLSKVWISFSSIIVASSFIFSKAISDVFLSVIFLFVVHPYDVGDGIMIGQDLHYVSPQAPPAASISWEKFLPSAMLNNEALICSGRF